MWGGDVEMHATLWWRTHALTRQDWPSGTRTPVPWPQVCVGGRVTCFPARVTSSAAVLQESVRVQVVVASGRQSPEAIGCPRGMPCQTVVMRLVSGCGKPFDLLPTSLTHSLGHCWPGENIHHSKNNVFGLCCVRAHKTCPSHQGSFFIA
jgi:hypothetical protein